MWTFNLPSHYKIYDKYKFWFQVSDLKLTVILGADGMFSLHLVTDSSGEDKTMSFICDVLWKVIDELGPGNIFSVVIHGTCKGVKIPPKK
jgi:hypothetical protein